MYTLDFKELHQRLITYLRDSVRNGDMTERRLARLTGVSQPHIHHVLGGKRSFSTETAQNPSVSSSTIARALPPGCSLERR